MIYLSGLCSLALSAINLTNNKAQIVDTTNETVEKP
jgi:hypothetical protein